MNSLPSVAVRSMDSICLVFTLPRFMMIPHVSGK